MGQKSDVDPNAPVSPDVPETPVAPDAPQTPDTPGNDENKDGLTAGQETADTVGDVLGI